jgi:two-component system sensor histidine kinase KdpD
VARALDVIEADEGRVDVDLPNHMPPVEVDPAQLERALVNVIENALKFSGLGERVALHATTEGGEVFLHVIDCGPGISDDERERVFEPFVRGTSANGDRGSGLGLAIARGFVGLNGGRLWVEPSSTGGSEFVLALPAAALPVEVIA